MLLYFWKARRGQLHLLLFKVAQKTLKVMNQHSQPILLLQRGMFLGETGYSRQKCRVGLDPLGITWIVKNWHSIPGFAVNCGGLSPLLKIRQHPLVESVSVEVNSICGITLL